jgi:16S rRNA (cytidine1402-2'-O)-methyltransferase
MLSVVALPIGNLEDISLRAIRLLKAADVIIGEERKELIPLLKHFEVDFHSKTLEFLNEHSDKEDLNHFLKLCSEKNVALVSDCGTPVFCDPGAHLIALCRREKIPVVSAPGASSLMTLLSLSSEKLQKFYFAGFLPREKEERQREIKKLSTLKESFIVMDTPYRLKPTIDQLAIQMPNRKALLGCDLTQENEMVIEAPLSKINSQISPEDKKEFILLVY